MNKSKKNEGNDKKNENKITNIEGGGGGGGGKRIKMREMKKMYEWKD